MMLCFWAKQRPRLPGASFATAGFRSRFAEVVLSRIWVPYWVRHLLGMARTYRCVISFSHGFPEFSHVPRRSFTVRHSSCAC